MKVNLRTGIILVLVVGLAAGVALFGSAQRHQEHELTFWTMSLSPHFDDYIEGVVAEYERQNPDVSVNWRDIPASTIEEQFLAAVAGREVPDVVNLPSRWVIGMAQKDALHSMEDIISPADRDRYFEGIWVSSLWNDKTWGVPWYVAPDVMVYNRELFAEAGLDPNATPATWDEAIETARIIQEATGHYGFLPNFILGDILDRDGIDLLSDDGRTAVFHTPEAVASITKWLDVYREGLVPLEVATEVRTAYLDAVQRYQGGRLGMLITGPQFIMRVKEESPDVYEQTDVAGVPVGDAGTFGAAVQHLVIPKAARDAELAADFALFVTNAENQVAFGKQVTVFPSVIAGAADPFFTDPDDTLEGRARKIGAQQLEFVDATPLDLPDTALMVEILDDAMSNTLLETKTPAEALAQAEMEWQTILDQAYRAAQ